MGADMKLYLQATTTIDADNETVKETASRITTGCTSDQQRAIKLFYFVRDEIRYNVYMISVFIEDFKASRILEWGKGYCVQKAVLLAALGRAAGIPTRLVFAKIKNHKLPAHLLEMIGTNIFPRHGYNQFFLGGKWVSAAPTFDKKLCEKNGLPTVEFDGRSNAVLPEHDRKGEPFIEYVERFPPRDDLPFEWIARKISTMVGPDKRPWLDGSRERRISPDRDTVL
jgi:transglutaminase-like putative cysteine protease